jgi:hypothetical protein
MERILYKSAEVRREIGRLFSSAKGRRVAISAFVGKGAEAYPRKPKGITLICWPKAGGTNPNALRTPKGLGVNIYFANSLHMKVYWTEDCGAIITSANLSTDALGSGNLKEIGIVLRSDAIDIDNLISSLKGRRITEAELRDLDRRHKIYRSLNPFESDKKDKQLTFSEWHASYKPTEWKLFMLEDYGPRSSIAEEVARKEHGVRTFQYSLAVQRNQYKEGDWVLCFKTSRNSLRQVSWVYTNFIVKVPRSDKEAYDSDAPYELVQVQPLSRYESPPFRIDTRFRFAFLKTLVDYGKSWLENQTKPTPRMINKIRRHYDS